MSGYWVLVCNPERWAVDDFLRSGKRDDTWGIRPSDAPAFAPGQLAVVRVGIDHRTRAALGPRKRLDAGIYAVCQIESAAYPRGLDDDAFWATGQGRAPGWPTVRVRYLRSFLDQPLSIRTLRERRPDIEPLLLKGFQGSSFPISEGDFETILSDLGQDPAALAVDVPEPTADPKSLAALAAKYGNAAPLVKHQLVRRYERGDIGKHVKKLALYRCQICEAFGLPSEGFPTKSGKYVEAHHVRAVSGLGAGVLAFDNVISVCANHHRQLHFGDIAWREDAGFFEFEFPAGVARVAKHQLPRA